MKLRVYELDDHRDRRATVDRLVSNGWKVAGYQATPRPSGVVTHYVLLEWPGLYEPEGNAVP